MAFLLLNLFLSYQLWLQGGVSSATPLQRDGEMPRLEVALEEAGLTMDFSPPRGAMRLSHLSVEPVELSRQELLNFFFPQADELVVQRVDQHIHYRQGDRNLSIDPTGLVSFRLDRENNAEEITEEEALQLAPELLEIIAAQVELQEDYHMPRGEGWFLNYSQEFNDFPIFSGYLQIQVAGKEIVNVELYLLDPLEFSGQEREIIPVSTALLRFLEEYGQDVAGTEIIKLDLGFYSPQYVAERWEIPPVWRILIDSGEVFYINAFTGHLEGN